MNFLISVAVVALLCLSGCSTSRSTAGGTVSGGQNGVAETSTANQPEELEFVPLNPNNNNRERPAGAISPVPGSSSVPLQKHRAESDR